MKSIQVENERFYVIEHKKYIDMLTSGNNRGTIIECKFCYQVERDHDGTIYGYALYDYYTLSSFNQLSYRATFDTRKEMMEWVNNY